MKTVLILTAVLLGATSSGGCTITKKTVEFPDSITLKFTGEDDVLLGPPGGETDPERTLKMGGIEVGTTGGAANRFLVFVVNQNDEIKQDAEVQASANAALTGQGNAEATQEPIPPKPEEPEEPPTE